MQKYWIRINHIYEAGQWAESTNPPQVCLPYSDGRPWPELKRTISYTDLGLGLFYVQDTSPDVQATLWQTNINLNTDGMAFVSAHLTNYNSWQWAAN